MNILIFGATGMVGQGVLRECLAAPDVERVSTIGRTATGGSHPRLREIVHANLFDYAPVEAQLKGFDACFFCLGVSSAGMSEADYTRMTYDLAVATATVLARLNPRMVFVFVSGASTDSSEKGRVMWARVKGRAENAIARLPFRAVYLFRPGVIQPLDGIKSKTAAYRRMYVVLGPLLPIARKLFPRQVVTTRDIGQAMLAVAREGGPGRILEAPDIRAAVS